MAGESCMTKIGPWGGNGGTEYGIPDWLPVKRLESVTISSDVVVYSIEFSYILGAAGEEEQTAGPWGGHGAVTDKIQFAPAEVMTEVSGTIGFSVSKGDDVVTSLKLVTNVRTYGPFGLPNGISFSVPLAETNVVGFFVRAGELVYALGVYVTPN